MRKLIALTLTLIIAMGLNAISPLCLQTELGVAFSGYNDLLYPNIDKDVLPLSLSKDLSMKPKMDTRLRLRYLVHPKHEVAVLVSPKNFNFKGEMPRDMRFASLDIPAGSKVSGRYHHSVYRPSYRYRFDKKMLWLRSLGASLNISEYKAEIKALEQKASQRDYAIVPLIGFDLELPILEELSLILEGELMTADLGKADDLFFGLEFLINCELKLRTGYRYTVLGRETDKMHSIASFHSANITFNILLN